MLKLTIDHYTIRVHNLKRSTAFYENVLQLSELENKTRSSHIRWFSLGDGRELHVVEGETEGIATNIGVHLALKVNNFDEFLSHLKKYEVIPHNSKGDSGKTTTRADGVRQVYFTDPDGYWIEVNDADA